MFSPSQHFTEAKRYANKVGLTINFNKTQVLKLNNDVSTSLVYQTVILSSCCKLQVPWLKESHRILTTSNKDKQLHLTSLGSLGNTYHFPSAKIQVVWMTYFVNTVLRRRPVVPYRCSTPLLYYIYVRHQKNWNALEMKRFCKESTDNTSSTNSTCAVLLSTDSAISKFALYQSTQWQEQKRTASKQLYTTEPSVFSGEGA